MTTAQATTKEYTENKIANWFAEVKRTYGVHGESSVFVSDETITIITTENGKVDVVEYQLDHLESAEQAYNMWMER